MLRYRKEIIQDFLDDEKCRLEGGEKSVKKRRDLFDKISGVSDEELDDKDYKRYKRSYYCYILVSSVVALLLGALYCRLMETLAMIQTFLS